MYRDSLTILRHREYTLKGPGDVLLKYAKTNDGILPSSDNWCDELKGFDFKLASDSFDTKGRIDPHCTVAFNNNLSRVNLNKLSLNTVLLFEADGPWNLSGGPELFYALSEDTEFAFVFLADGNTYKYFFRRGEVKDESDGSYKSIRWNP